MKIPRYRQSTETRLKTRICNPFMVALGIIGLSTLPYFHDFITDADGLMAWVPVLGIESFLTDSNNRILGFSTYRVFLYTFLIFVFASIGWAGWYRIAKNKYYSNALLLVLTSGVYHVFLMVFNLRRTVVNELEPKLIMLSSLFLMLGYLSCRKHRISVRKVIVWVLVSVLATLPLLHDVITNRNGESWSWVPNLGIEAFLTDLEGMVRGLRSYRLLLYLFGIYLFSHLGWIGWFMDAEGKKYRVFLLVPAALSLYQVILILLSSRETEFNSPSINLYLTVGISILVAINFYYNNKVSPKTEVMDNKTTINTRENEN
jgi:hypothetical protein